MILSHGVPSTKTIKTNDVRIGLSLNKQKKKQNKNTKIKIKKRKICKTKVQKK